MYLQLVLEKVDLQKKINLGYLLLVQEKDRGRVPALRLNQERDAAGLDRQRDAAPGLDQFNLLVEAVTGFPLPADEALPQDYQ